MEIVSKVIDVKNLELKGIYAIHNKTKDKYYIGSSENIKSRISEHKTKFKQKRHVSEMQKDYNENDEFEIIILEQIENDWLLSTKEAYYCGLYNSIECGYNKTFPVRNWWAKKHFLEKSKNKLETENEILKSLIKDITMNLPIKTSKKKLKELGIPVEKLL